MERVKLTYAVRNKDRGYPWRVVTGGDIRESSDFW